MGTWFVEWKINLQKNRVVLSINKQKNVVISILTRLTSHQVGQPNLATNQAQSSFLSIGIVMTGMTVQFSWGPSSHDQSTP